MSAAERTLIPTKCPNCKNPLTGVIGPTERNIDGFPVEGAPWVVHTDCYWCGSTGKQAMPK